MSMIFFPVATEKASLLRENRVFAFYVSANSDKISLKKEFENLFNVKPIACNILKGFKPGKKSFLSRKKGKSFNYKKAYFSIDQSVDLNLEGFEGI